MESLGKAIKVNTVVAQNGTGDYQTVSEAVASYQNIVHQIKVKYGI